MSPENTMAPPTSQKRIDANRRNAQRSTGPRTPEGKSRSRFNGLRHGLAATVRVLPGEDPAAFQARVDAVVESFAPQNQVQVNLLERVAATTWSLERATRAEAAQLCHKIRHDAIEREQKEKEEALVVGQRLLWDARGRNEEIAGADAAGAPTRLAFDPSPEGEKLRRYLLSAARSVNQTLKTYLSVVSCQLRICPLSLVLCPL